VELTRISRKYAKLSLTITDDGQPVTPGAVDVALLPTDDSPSAATTWTTVTATAGTYRVLLAGPDADPSGGLTVPDDRMLWARVTDTPEIDAAPIERVTLI
jgi:hypothetical protein